MYSINLIRVISILNLLLMDSDFYKVQIISNYLKPTKNFEFTNQRIKKEFINTLDSIYADKELTSYQIFNNGDELQIYPSCGFDLYAIKDNTLLNQYNYRNWGHTCGAVAFVRDSTNYLIKGYGFWAYHFDLIYLNQTLGSWEFVKTINQPKDYFSNGVFQSSKGIYSLFGGNIDIIDQNVGIKEPNGYFLDWESKEWKKIKVQIDGVNNVDFVSNSNIYTLETKDYVLMMSDFDHKHIGWNIIEKESGLIYFYDNLKNYDVFLSPVIEVFDNKVSFQSTNNSNSFIDLDNLLSKSREVGKITISESDTKNKSFFPLKDKLYFLSLLILIVIIINLSLRNKTKKPKNKDFDEIENIADSLKKYSKQSLSGQELDEVLGIHLIENHDSKRMKRSRLVNRLNAYNQAKNGTDLIVRDKDQEDKRFVYYRIES